MDQATEDVVRIIDRWAQWRLKQSRTPGAAIALIEDGELVLDTTYGVGNLDTELEVGADTKFRLASITKTFTCLAVMQLVERKQLALDDPVSQHLGWFRSSVDARVESLTVRQLATHTAGLAREGMIRFPHDGYWPTEREVRAAVDNAIVVEPGVRFLYSNLGIAVLGAMVAELTGSPFHEFLRTQLFTPLGMNTTYCEPDPSTFDGIATGYLRAQADGTREPALLERLDAFAPAGGAVSCLADMVAYLRFWIHGDDAVLSAHLRREMLRTQWYQPDGSVRWGIGTQHWTVGGRDVFGHSGLLLGFAPRFGIDVERGRGAVVLANALDAPTVSILEASLRALETAKNKNFGSGASDRQRAGRFCGEFSNAWGDGMVTRLGESLISFYLDDSEVISQPDVLEIANDSELRILDGSFIGNVGQTLLFHFDTNDEPTSLHYGSYHAAMAKELTAWRV